MEPLAPPPSAFPEEAPGAHASRRLGLASIVAACTLFGFSIALVLGILGLVKASQAREAHSSEPDRYLPLRTGGGLAATGLVLAFLLPLFGAGLWAWPQIARTRRQAEAQRLLELQQNLGDRARAMRWRFKDERGLVNIEALAKALIAEAGPQWDPYNRRQAPILWVNHPKAFGQFALSEGYVTKDPATKRDVPTMFIRIALRDAVGKPDERTWIVGLD
jgi:hypothetical protein